MAVRKREEIIEQIRSRFGDDTSDDVITLLEDVTDTLTDLENKTNSDGKDWKAEAERIDKEWRQKYVARFNSASGGDDDDEGQNNGGRKDYSFDKLFK